MTERQIADFDETAGIVLAHSALFTSMFGVLKNQLALDQATVNEVFDLALVGLETAHHGRPRTFRVARQVLEEMAQAMGGKVGG